jgi:hypothetical protein
MALTLGGLLIVALVFGTALRSDWPTAGVQVVYAITYFSYSRTWVTIISPSILCLRNIPRFWLQKQLHDQSIKAIQTQSGNGHQEY